MKSYSDYAREYAELLAAVGDVKDKAVIKRNIWISMKWQTENNWNPWDGDAQARLLELEEHDKRLYDAVIEGVNVLTLACSSKTFLSREREE